MSSLLTGQLTNVTAAGFALGVSIPGLLQRYESTAQQSRTDIHIHHILEKQTKNVEA